MRVAILGTGNIGTDLLYKVFKSKHLKCTLFAGRSKNSEGIKRAKALGIPVSYKGIEDINNSICDLVFDCTSAQAHIEHTKKLKELNLRCIDLTPAKSGIFVVPSINKNSLQGIDFNLVTCGGQTTIPIAYAISKVHSNIDYIEVASSIASLSAGPATRNNLDEYVETTQDALKKFTNAKKTKAILILNPATPPIDMVTSIYAKIESPNLTEITKSVLNMVNDLQKYVPGYEVIVPPFIMNDKVVMTVKVTGAGDFLPKYAGNLDIINCAAIELAEYLA